MPSSFPIVCINLVSVPYTPCVSAFFTHLVSLPYLHTLHPDPDFPFPVLSICTALPHPKAYLAAGSASALAAALFAARMQFFALTAEVRHIAGHLIY